MGCNRNMKYDCIWAEMTIVFILLVKMWWVFLVGWNGYDGLKFWVTMWPTSKMSPLAQEFQNFTSPRHVVGHVIYVIQSAATWHATLAPTLAAMWHATSAARWHPRQQWGGTPRQQSGGIHASIQVSSHVTSVNNNIVTNSEYGSRMLICDEFYLICDRMIT
jgi:hypothetical protein